VDSQPYFDLTEGSAIKYIGSKLGDDVGGTDFSDVILGKAGADYLIGFTAATTTSRLARGTTSSLVLRLRQALGRLRTRRVRIQRGPHRAASGGLRQDQGLRPRQGCDRPVRLQRHRRTVPPGYLDNKYFHKGTEAKTADQHVIYDKKTGSIWFDGDGNGTDAQFLLAKVTAGTKLHADDFYTGTSLMA
jgi:Ca2+-binding RTX toxin-like protein